VLIPEWHSCARGPRPARSVLDRTRTKVIHGPSRIDRHWLESGCRRNPLGWSRQNIGLPVARAARASERRRATPGREWVAVFMNEDTIVIALHGSLTDAERALTRTPAGNARVRAFHRQLFADVADTLRQQIRSITGMEVRGTTVEIDLTTGTVMHVLTTDTVLAEFLSAPDATASRPGHGCSAGSQVRQDSILKAATPVRVRRWPGPGSDTPVLLGDINGQDAGNGVPRAE
jgi:uncharacterized protein YbcI